MKFTKCFLLSLFAAVLFCSCNREKSFTINGSINLPDQIPYGDTLIDVPSLEGTWVYLLDLENEMYDSVQVANDAFTFEGKVKAKEPFYLQLATQLGSTLVAIEPGEIDVELGAQGLTVSGTPSNDAMSDVDAVMENLNNDMYSYYSEIVDSLRNLGQELTTDQQLHLAQEFQNKMATQLDSVYQANKDNLGAAYAVLMGNMDSQSSAQFEEAIKKYPEEIQNNELIQFNLKMLKQYEQMYDSTNDMLPDSLMLQPEEVAKPNK